MKIDIEIILVAIVVLFFAVLVLALRLFIDKLKKDDKKQTNDRLKKEIISKWVANRNVKKGKAFYELFNHVSDIVHLDVETNKATQKNLNSYSLIRRSFSRIKSPFKFRRIEAAINLSHLCDEKAANAIEQALIGEKSTQVKLYMANALSDLGYEKSIPVLIASLLGENKWYRSKVNMLIADYGEKVEPYIPQLVKRNEIEIMEFLADMASVYPSRKLKNYVFDQLDSYEKNRQRLITVSAISKENIKCENCIYGSAADIMHAAKCRYNKVIENQESCRNFKTNMNNDFVIEYFDQIIYKVADVAVKYYFIDFAKDKYMNHKNIVIKNKSVEAFAKNIDEYNVFKLKKMLSNEVISKTALVCLSKVIQEKPEIIDEVSDMLIAEQDENIQLKLAETLSGKIEYFIMKLLSNEKEYAAKIIKQILILGKTSEFIGFINNNKDIDIENYLTQILKEAINENKGIETDLKTYLKPSILRKVGLKKIVIKKEERVYKKKQDLVKSLYIIMVFVLLLFPIIYVMRHYSTLGIWTWLMHIKTYAIDFNYYLAFYSAMINLIYLILILLSRINVSRQARTWSFKSDKMLFKNRMLPSTSIIAPAHNEENIIIESTNSLLNLKYPDYNLIIVNDGSTDNTLNILIDYFELERIDYTYDYDMKVAPIRGVFSNPAHPKLLVVDKENAGKADSINAGIVISDKEYFCCIDADSLLEDDALLKLASQTLDEQVETPALGGNVFPINGCSVSKGYISNKRIPKNFIARLQTIEYMRAFMSGRLGWSYLNSLLIISGAFGLFRKERVLNVGGYLTASSIYNKDTVGEDMELVVRISRLMHEKGKKFKINYCYNANCWTEVPEKLNQLKSQRLRWYRGLVETLHFHKKTIFNPKYGRMGLLGMPYFFLFEMVGPLIEVQGYLMVIVAFFLGILSMEIALLLFLTSIIFGVLVSIVSLDIAETNNNHYKYGDILRLIGVAIIENFGPRQLFSFWRVWGYLKMFSSEHRWGLQKRKGFSQKHDKDDKK